MTQLQYVNISMPGLLIGMSGYAQSGKDTVGKLLVENHGFRRLAFADSLRQLAIEVDPIVSAVQLADETLAGDELPEVRLDRLAEVVDEVGWEEAKRNPVVRQFLQDLGTGCREVLDPDCWIKPVERQIKSDMTFPTVITDVRFPNEAKLIKQLGGVVWRISRPGYSPANAHVSERALDNWAFDHVFVNDSTVEELSFYVSCALGVTSEQSPPR